MSHELSGKIGNLQKMIESDINNYNDFQSKKSDLIEALKEIDNKISESKEKKRKKMHNNANSEIIEDNFYIKNHLNFNYDDNEEKEILKTNEQNEILKLKENLIATNSSNKKSEEEEKDKPLATEDLVQKDSNKIESKNIDKDDKEEIINANLKSEEQIQNAESNLDEISNYSCSRLTKNFRGNIENDNLEKDTINLDKESIMNNNNDNIHTIPSNTQSINTFTSNSNLIFQNYLDPAESKKIITNSNTNANPNSTNVNNLKEDNKENLYSEKIEKKAEINFENPLLTKTYETLNQLSSKKKIENKIINENVESKVIEKQYNKTEGGIDGINGLPGIDNSNIIIRNIDSEPRKKIEYIKENNIIKDEEKLENKKDDIDKIEYKYKYNSEFTTFKEPLRNNSNNKQDILLKYNQNDIDNVNSVEKPYNNQIIETAKYDKKDFPLARQDYSKYKSQAVRDLLQENERKRKLKEKELYKNIINNYNEIDQEANIPSKENNYLYKNRNNIINDIFSKDKEVDANIYKYGMNYGNSSNLENLNIRNIPQKDKEEIESGKAYLNIRKSEDKFERIPKYPMNKDLESIDKNINNIDIKNLVYETPDQNVIDRGLLDSNLFSIPGNFINSNSFEEYHNFPLKKEVKQQDFDDNKDFGDKFIMTESVKSQTKAKLKASRVADIIVKAESNDIVKNILTEIYSKNIFYELTNPKVDAEFVESVENTINEIEKLEVQEKAKIDLREKNNLNIENRQNRGYETFKNDSVPDDLIYNNYYYNKILDNELNYYSKYNQLDTRNYGDILSGKYDALSMKFLDTQKMDYSGKFDTKLIPKKSLTRASSTGRTKKTKRKETSFDKEYNILKNNRKGNGHSKSHKRTFINYTCAAGGYFDPGIQNGGESILNKSIPKPKRNKKNLKKNASDKILSAYN